MTDRTTQETTHAGFAARLLQGAKDLVWQETPAPRNAGVPGTGRNEGASAPALPPAVADSSTQNAGNRMTGELMGVVMSRPTAYSALAEALAALAEIPMDEATRYRSSFAVLRKTQQRTIEQLIQAIDVHLSILESEKTRFAGQSRSVEDDEITARQAQAASLGDAVAEGAKQIAKLRADTDALVAQIESDMAAKRAQAAELSRETEQKKLLIARTSRDFEAASEAVRLTLQGEKSRIHKYLT